MSREETKRNRSSTLPMRLTNNMAIETLKQEQKQAIKQSFRNPKTYIDPVEEGNVVLKDRISFSTSRRSSRTSTNSSRRPSLYKRLLANVKPGDHTSTEDLISETSFGTSMMSSFHNMNEHSVAEDEGHGVVINHQQEIAQLNNLVSQFMCCGFPVIVFDRMGYIVYMNRDSEELFGTFSFSVLGEELGEVFMEDTILDIHTIMSDFLGFAMDDIIGVDRQNISLKNMPYELLNYSERAKRRAELSKERILKGKALSLNQYFIISTKIIPIKKKQEIHFCAYMKFGQFIENEGINNMSENFNSICTDVSIAPIVAINDKGRVLVFNKAATLTFGYESGEIIGKNVKIICNKKDRMIHDEYLENFMRTEKKKILDRIKKVKGQSKDGKSIPLEIKISQIVNNGQSSFVAYFRDYKFLSSQGEQMAGIAEKIYPRNIAERLSMGQKVIDQIDGCSMLYCDLVGFTELSSTMPPKQVVDILHSIFSKFDEICQKFRMEKIKTIGDSYFLASGLRNEKDSVDHSIKGGLSMIRTICTFSETTGNNLKVRVGIHTSIGGDVIAAVVGKVKRTYDLFGSDVKIAQLMEMTGKTNELHISNNTYKLLRSEKRKSLFIEHYREGEEILLDKYAEPLLIPTNTWVTDNVIELIKEKTL